MRKNWSLLRRGKNVPAHRNLEDPFAVLRQDMNRLFDGFLGEREWFPSRFFDGGTGLAMPSVDVSETDKEIVVTAELPGIDEKDVEVSVTQDALTLRGEKKAEFEDKKKGQYLMERSYGSFHRVIELPAEVDREKVAATFKKGVLTVTLPKTEEAKKEAKKVSVQSG